MIDKTDMETRAIKHARQNLAEVLTAMGLMAPFLDRSAAEIDRIIEACVDGFQEGMQMQTPSAIRSRTTFPFEGSPDDRSQPRLGADLPAAAPTAATSTTRQRPASTRRSWRGTAASARATISAAAGSASPATASSSTSSPTPRRTPAPTSRARSCGSSTPGTPSRRSRSAGCARPASTCATSGQDGRQFGFTTAGGRLRGHIDGVIVAGPDIGVRWPALWEHKALNAKSWADLVKRGLRLSKPIYFAQVQLYMAYMELEVGALHRAQQGQPGAPPRGRRRSSRPRRRRSPTGPSPSSAPPTPASCRRASPPPPTSTSAACAPGRSAAGRGGA